jgi:hypothetical protein
MSPQTAAAATEVLKKILSDKQREANRRHAQKSTGPNTEAGKAKSKLNAGRHGLTGQVVTMTEPDLIAYQAFIEKINKAWSPVGAMEVQLATRIAHESWRLNRAAAIEDNIFGMGIGYIQYATESENHPEIEDAFAQARTFQKEAKNLQLLTLYEQRITRAIEKNKKMLTDLQKERREREAKQMEEAKRLLELAEVKGQDYKPEADGFVFSTQQIHVAIDRDRRLKQAAHVNLSRSERRKFRRQPFANAA